MKGQLFSNSLLSAGFLSCLLLASLYGQAQNSASDREAIRKYLSGGLTWKNSPDSAALKEGDLAPDFYLVDTSLKTVSLRDLKGKYVVLDIWASWCTWCIKEYPALSKLKEDLKGRNIAFVSLSCDHAVPRWREAMGAYQLKNNQQWLITDNAFMKAFQVNKIPRFILLDKEGKVCNLDMTRPSNPETEEYLKGLKGI